MTSGPRSARMVVATGPAMKLALSMTRRPSSKGIAEARSARAAPGRRRALAQQSQSQQGHADADRGVRHVESRPVPGAPVDRKSTRLNSSHSQISYAVFCLKKKNTANTSV